MGIALSGKHFPVKTDLVHSYFTVLTLGAKQASHKYLELEEVIKAHIYPQPVPHCTPSNETTQRFYHTGYLETTKVTDNNKGN